MTRSFAEAASPLPKRKRNIQDDIGQLELVEARMSKDKTPKTMQCKLQQCDPIDVNLEDFNSPSHEVLKQKQPRNVSCMPQNSRSCGDTDLSGEGPQPQEEHWDKEHNLLETTDLDVIEGNHDLPASMSVTHHVKMGQMREGYQGEIPDDTGDGDDIDFTISQVSDRHHVEIVHDGLPSFNPPDRDYQIALCKKVGIDPVDGLLGILARSNAHCLSPSRKHVTKGDGNCFYRAISYCITGTQDHHEQLRMVLHSHMWNNIRLAEIFAMTANEFRHYLANKGPSNNNNTRQWATDIEIFFMSHLLQTDIAVYRYEAGAMKGWHLHDCNYIESTASTKSSNGNLATIYIDNPNGDHYDVVLAAHQPSWHEINRPAVEHGQDEPATKPCNLINKVEASGDPDDGPCRDDNLNPDIPGPSGINRRVVSKGDYSTTPNEAVAWFWSQRIPTNFNGISLNKAFKLYSKTFPKLSFNEFQAMSLPIVKNSGLVVKKKSSGTILKINSVSRTGASSPTKCYSKSKQVSHDADLLITLKDFIGSHYKKTDEQASEVKPLQVFKLFSQNSSVKALTYKKFLQLVNRVPCAKLITRGASRVSTLKLKPSSKASINFHRFQYDTPSETPAIARGGYNTSDSQGFENIKKFVGLHYNTSIGSLKTQLLTIYHFFQQSKSYNGETLEQFEQLLCQEHPVTMISSSQKSTKVTNLEPSSAACKSFHTDTAKKNYEKDNSIHLALANIEGLITNKRNKCSFVRDVTRTDKRHQIIVLTETWTKKNYEAEITAHFKDYHLYQSDREFDPNKKDPKQLKNRGGTCIITSPEVTITPGPRFSNGNCEVAIAKLPTINTLVISLYRPSGKNFCLLKFTEALSHIRQYLSEKAEELEQTHITLMGDFNFPKKIVNWRESDLGLVADFTEGEDIQKKAFDLLIQLTDEYQMEQLVSQPTRGRNILDLVFSNQSHLFGDCYTTALKPLSDHKLVNFNMTNPTTIRDQNAPLQCHHNIPVIATFNFGNADKESLQKRLKEANWKEILKVTPAHDVTTLAKRFVDGVAQAARLAKVPKFAQRSDEEKLSSNHLRLLEERRQIISKIEHPHCTLKDKKDQEGRMEEVNKKIQGLHEEERKSKEKAAIEKIKLDPKEFYRFANKSKKAKTKIGPLKSGDNFYSGPQKMAQILSDQYKSVFSPHRESYEDFHFPKRAIKDISDIIITENKLINEMQSIKLSSAPGPDGVPAILYKHYAEQLSYPLLLLWQASLDSGKMPDGTLLAFITPIPKSVDRSIPANYRPVALTNHLTKVFERVLRRELTEHLENEGLLNKTQHGFRERHSTITQILCYYDSILTLMGNGDPVDAIYLDFAKAFDKVDHQILLKKVEGLGITGKLYVWIKEFLTNRQQQVKIGSYLSTKEWVRSGVPQGSVLGPLLFLIMMVDIDEKVKHSLLGSFADDTRLWRTIHGLEDQKLLQEDLQVLYEWAADNNASFNDDKFEHLSHGSESSRDYFSPSGKVIAKKATVKDLGVYVSGNGNFEEHISNCVKSALQVSAWILRTFLSRLKVVMKVLLQMLVVPHVEYASPVWCPFDRTHINMLENVQRRFTSRILEYNTWDERLGMCICTSNYWERLADLKIYSLERRRERFIILYAYRVIIGLISFPWFDAYVERGGILLRAKYNHRAPHSVKRNRHSSFFYKAPQLYNLLPPELRKHEEITTPSQQHVEDFKGDLDTFLEKVPDQPDVDDLNKMRNATTNSLICQIPLYKRQHPEAFRGFQRKNQHSAA